MTRLFPLCGLLLALAGCLPSRPAPVPETPPAVREIAGVLVGETILSGEVLLSGDILVPRGSTLIIQPGTLVRIRPSESTKIDPEYLSSATEILVRGTLRCEGSEEAPIRFEAGPLPSGETIAWAGIIFDGGNGVVAWSSLAAAENGILCIAAAPEIHHNTIAGCRYGIVTQKGSEPKILDNVITGGEGGIFCWLDSRPYLLHNRISSHAEEGIFVDASSRPWLDRNEVRGNAIGLALFPRDLPFDATGITGNGEDVRFLGSGGGQ